MNAKALIPLAAGLGIGGLALFLGINTLKNARATQRPTAKVRLLAARENISRGTAITEQLLKAVEYPTELVPAGSFQKKENLIGRVPCVTAPAGLPILEEMLAPPGSRPGILVKPGYRAIAVKIDAGSGVDYNIEPGCFVDVVGSFKVRRNGRTETIAKTIIENAEVAAVGQRLSPDTSREEDGAGPKPKVDPSRMIRAVTLFVKPEDVPRLLLTEQEGRVKLSLRGSEDDVTLDDPASVSDGELLGDEEPEAKAEPAPQPAPPPGPSPALEFVRALFDKLGERAALAAVEPQPEPWRLHIYRGKSEEVVAFKDRNSSERVIEARGAVAAPRPAPAAPPAPPQPAPAQPPQPAPPSPPVEASDTPDSNQTEPDETEEFSE